MFGGQKNTFGAQPAAPAFSAFNTQPQQNTGFGQSAFAKPAGAFGSNFGQPTTSVFGAQPTAGTSLFGSSQPQQQQQGFGTFGQPQQQQTSIFGSTNTTGTTSLFGSQPQTSAFGAAKPTTFGFGQPQQASNSLLSSTPAQTSLWGQTATTNTAGGGLFGSPSTSGFGQPTVGGQQNGTAIAKFQPPQETDTLMKGSQTSYVQTKQQCITFMKEYAEKSLEELRIEDYAANRKGPQAGSSTGMFGAPQSAGVFGSTMNQQQPTTSLFGAQQNTQPSTGLFGSTTNALGGGSAFGASTSTFGQPSTGGLFGKPLTAPATTASAFTAFGAGTSTFGAPKPFGAVQGTPSTGLFGQSQAPAFGATSTNTFGTATGFGQQQPAQNTGGLFGSSQPAAAPTFGLGAASTPQTGFGFGTTNTQQTAGGLFGAQKPAFGTGAPTFGAPQTSTATTGFTGFGNTGTTGGLFGSTAAKPAFGFGQPSTSTQQAVSFGQPATGGLFGSSTATGGGGLFGSSQPTGGLFGGGTNTFGGGNTGLSFGQQQPSLFGQQQSQLQQQAGPEIHQKILALITNPYGDNELFKGLKPLSAEDSLRPTNPAAQKALLETSNNFKVSPNTGSKIRVKPITAVGSKKTLFDGLEEYDASLDESFSLKTNPKRLIIKPRADKPSMPKTLNDTTEDFQNQIPIIQPQVEEADTDRRVSWLKTAPTQVIRGRPKVGGDTTLSQIVKEVPEAEQSLNETFRSDVDQDAEVDVSIVTPAEPHPTGIVLRRAGYYTIPSLDEITEFMDIEGRCFVPNFTIGRRGYGNVYFDEEIDVSGLNLDEICHFRNKEIILYQDDENKPPVGEGLNRKAQVTLDKIWPHDKTTHEPIKDVERLELMDYEAKLRRICDKRGTKFLEYRPETGSCVFKVDHFSKYTLDDDSEDDEGEPRADPKKAKLVQNGKNLENGKEKAGNAVIAAPEGIQRLRQQETTFFLGQHAGQRSFQPYSHPIDDDIDLTREPTSPSITLAKEMRADAHKLQLMKASFFVDDDYDTRSIMSDATEGRESPDQMVPSKPSFVSRLLMSGAAKVASPVRKLVVDDEPQPMQEETPEVAKRNDLIPTLIPKPVGPKSAPLVVRPRVMLFDVSETLLPMTDSILAPMIEKRNNTTPFFHGRKFKISWTHGNKFTVLSSKASSIFNGRGPTDSSKSLVKICQVKTLENEKFRESIVEHLRIELKHDKKIEGSTRLEAGGGTAGLLEHHQLAQKLNKSSKFNATVFSLMHALWGFIDDVDPQEHAVVMLRRDLLSAWLENVVAENKPNLDYLDLLVNLLQCHKVNDACDLAITNGDVNLSLLISQASSAPAVRQLIQHQLASWREVSADEFIDERRLRVMMMVGGVSVMDGPGGGVINIFESLDWLKCLAFQLWYISSPVHSVTDAVLSYETNFLQEDFEVASPGTKNFDVRFHLLKLFSQRSHRMEAMLDPEEATDYRLPFLLLQTLETLGYRHVSDVCRMKIYTSLAEQLEAQGLWEYSVFVMLHVADDNQRELAVQQLLYRHIRIDGEIEDDGKEKFLVDELRIPEKWLNYAKAVRAGVMGSHHLEVKYLLKAEQWSKAHDVMMQHIAPDLVINDQMEFLKSLLEHFKLTRDIQNWKTQGEVLVNFIELNEKFKNIEEVDADLFLEQISSKLSDLCSVIRLFPCPTPKHRLTQCEIAKQLAFIIRNFYANSSAYGNQACALMRTALERLPLPQEFAQQELKHVLRTFMMEKLSIN